MHLYPTDNCHTRQAISTRSTIVLHDVLRRYPSASRTPSSPVCIHSVPSVSRRMTALVCASFSQYLHPHAEKHFQTPLVAAAAAKAATTHPFCNRYPETNTSPGTPMGTTSPASSIIFARTCGWTFPTVSTRCRIGSSGVVWKATGLQRGSVRSALPAEGRDAYLSSAGDERREWSTEGSAGGVEYGLTHSVGVCDVSQMKIRDELVHQVDRDRRARSDARPTTTGFNQPRIHHRSSKLCCAPQAA